MIDRWASQRGRLLASEQADVAHVPSATTRAQYVQRSKESALALLRAGQIQEAVASMMMAMRKYPDCEAPHEVNMIAILAVADGDIALARAYIDGFH
ncbi:hypothetical protein P0R31_12180 [Bradyrhizobium yuanmingense]|uniref:hypothetical protein n=1 Tax=Bradyrhizobium yuanmingense TaxID=108015 RepID=UPI0023B95762|nr:hypothetical protein [Bradyrhizobium yuanmingense]MDF0517990.1 hypothetical protein [Bradyrhizobium yuanmingense]